MTSPDTFSTKQYLAAWLVHLFTASAAFVGALSLYQIYQHHYLFALWLMGITVTIDALDGSFARLVKVKVVLPKIDGALLDNIVDFLNYVITPCFFLLVKPGMLPSHWANVIIFCITIASCYQFCQAEAKTPDHFFKGFPCYWNFALFYMFILDTSPMANTVILMILCVLIFVPIKYVYPSRLDYLTHSKKLKLLMHFFSLIFAISSSIILLKYPAKNNVFLAISLGYVLLYFILSIYRTYSPMIFARIYSPRH